MIGQVAVLGQGQLGWMLKTAGERLGMEVTLLDPNTPEQPAAQVLITAESEHWPDNAGTRALQAHPGWCNAAALALLPDRRQQKRLFDTLELPTSAWVEPTAESTVEALRSALGEDFFLKRARGGYDGKGQQRFGPTDASPLPDWSTDAIAEAAVGFDTEVSLVGARKADGTCVFYPLTENLHRSGTLTMSINRPAAHSQYQARAEAMLEAVMSELDYVGVMAMECFLVGDQLIINELAPRVHNSGHWTQAGASICQFELHWRALLGLPLPQPVLTGTTVMVNLLGVDHQPQWLSVPGARLYWYRKTLRPGRKMGHINLNHQDPAILSRWLRDLSLPDDYQASRDWALERLALVSAQAQTQEER